MRLDVPLVRWVSSYRRQWLRTDLVAGATVWAVLIPSALAYAVIVGVEPIVGLYTVPLAIVGYAIFGGSKLLVVGPDAAISVLAASTVAAVSTGDDYLELTIALTLLVGVLYVALYLLRMGWAADLVPDPVLKGFIQGLVWVTILDQIPKLVGVELVDPPSDFWRRFVDIAGELGSLQTETAVLGVISLVALFGLKRMIPALPGPLVVVAATIALVALVGLGDEGVAVVGEPSGAVLELGLPSGLELDQLVDLVPGALAIVVLGFTESMGAAKAAAQKTGERLDPGQELLAIGTSNLGAGLSGGFVVTGALSKTSVAIASGGRTQVGNLFAAVLGVLTIVVLRPLFEHLALTALAAIIVFAMAGMINASYFTLLWRLSRVEFLVALVAFLGVLTFGVLQGVVIAVVLSLVILVHHIGDPPSSVLGRTPTGSWQDIERSEEAEQLEGVLVWRQEAPLIFLNARRLVDRLRHLISDDIRVVVVDASVVSAVDTTGITAFMDLGDELRSRQIKLWIAHPLLRTWAKAQAQAGAGERPLPHLADSVDDAVAELLASGPPNPGAPPAN
ncbi:MAG: SulP family inorganic anion transporter [Actinomycetia bacterium]|nr:SulP family inorganic anion transporter [Actinomycetes bacterium]